MSDSEGWRTIRISGKARQHPQFAGLMRTVKAVGGESEDEQEQGSRSLRPSWPNIAVRMRQTKRPAGFLAT